MEQPAPVPFDPRGVALRFAPLPACVYLGLAVGDRNWSDAVVACHELWHGEDKQKGNPALCYLARHKWDVQAGWPPTLVKSVHWDNSRPVRLTSKTTDKALNAAIQKCALPLTSLSLNEAPISDASMASVGSLVTLTDLDLSFTKITDAGLAQLTGLKELRSLNLTNSPFSSMEISDAGLAHVAAFTHLERLILEWNSIEGHGLAHLSHLTNLRELSLTGTSITDDSLAHLAPLTEMVRLELHSGINGKGFVHLYGMVKLQFLDLRSVRCQGLEALVERLPNCVIQQ